MTSEDYARMCLRTLRSALDSDERFDEPGYNRLSILLITRIMGAGADEYEIDDQTQQAEVKPLPDLIRDMEEEVTDLVAYASMFAARTHSDMRPLVSMAIMMMNMIDHIKDEFE